jgi:hypothetical protein
MSPLVAYCFILLIPVAVVGACCKGWDLLVGYHPSPKGPVPAARSIEQLAGDLRRLRDEEARLRSGDLPAKATRLRIVSLAYDDTLCASCQALGLPSPGPPPLPVPVRHRTEAALAAQGLGR